MIRSAAVLGAGTMGAQIAAHLANAGVPTLLLDLTPELARQGLARARALKPDPFFTPGRDRADHHRRASTTCPRSAARTGSSRRSSRISPSSRRCSSGSRRSASRARSSHPTHRAFRSRRSPRAAATSSGGTGWARTSSTRRAICTCSRSFRPADTDPAVVDEPVALCRSPPRQGRRARARHAELHREPHRPVRA